MNAAKESRPKRTRRSDVTTYATRCQKCQSTERERYKKSVTTKVGGIHDGKPYTHFKRCWTRCKACGQARVDRIFENLVEKSATA